MSSRWPFVLLVLAGLLALTFAGSIPKAEIDRVREKSRLMQEKARGLLFGSFFDKPEIGSHKVLLDSVNSFGNVAAQASELINEVVKLAKQIPAKKIRDIKLEA